MFGDSPGGHDRANLEAVIERLWRCTWRPRSREFGDALGGRDRARLEMHLEAMIKRVLEMHFVAMIEQDSIYTWRL
jgi:hypothetical protein